MDGYRTVWSHAEGTTRILVTAVAIVAVQILAVFLFSVTTLPFALAVPLAVLLGPAAAWGVALGAVFYELAAAGLGVYPLVLFLDVFVCAVVGRELWQALPNATLRRPLAAVLGIVPAAVVATLLGVGLAVVLSSVVVNLGASTVPPPLVSQRLLLAVVLGPALLAAGYRWYSPEWDDRETPLLRWVGTMAVAGGIVTAWLVGTMLFGLVRRDVEMFPEIGESITGAVPSPLDAMVALMFGPYGWVFYLVGALGALLLVAAVLRTGLTWSPPARRAERDAVNGQDTQKRVFERFRS